MQSVDRAVSVMEFLSRQGLSSLTEIANELDIHKSTVYRLLATLEYRGIVEQDPDTERYRLGFGLAAMAGSVTADLDIVRHSRGICQSLSDETEETVTLEVLEGNEAVIIHQSISSSSVLGADWSGSHTPLHCTASGKVLMAHMPSRRVNGLLRKQLEAKTDNTIVEPDHLREQFQEIRESGYGYTVEELEVGLNAVGAPIHASDGNVVGAVSLSGPAFRLPLESIPDYGRLTAGAGSDISRRFGYHRGATTGR
ncbi:IclR family transcriptional regulator [Rubrobacter aplysinae]|uniref:IclR family transcriptional regulator n=1 Tax=Rubrobacter aplysinae TaxID=909625 RepID=UPI001F1956E2|nr:IclR family transcriptional regulator [Rubrobacter aplysinae]